MKVSDIDFDFVNKQANGNRKREHLDICLTKKVKPEELTTGLEQYCFIHQALPEINLCDVDTSTDILNKKLNAPIIISAMVGGIKEAERINRNLAQTAQSMGLAMGVGSQRCGIDDPESGFSYRVRDVAPGILLFANLGAVQLNNGYGLDECKKAVDMIGADALVLHLNPLQEALQPGGNTNFGNLVDKIEQICSRIRVPVIVKEVGWGISEDVAKKLVQAGVIGIDVAGGGGTSWSEIEKYRGETPQHKNIAAAFASWGIPTVDSIAMVRLAAPDSLLIASGGIRDGIDVAKVVALGAHAAGIAGLLLQAANRSTEMVINALQEVVEALRIAMFCIGARNIKELRDSTSLIKKPWSTDR